VADVEERIWEQGTPVGVVRVHTVRGRIRSITLGDEEPLASPTEPEPRVSGALGRYFAGDAGALEDLPVDVEGTDFRRAVWQELRRIPPGATVTYGQLAGRLGRTMRAARAVGGAVGSNPVPFVIPCHRVLAAGGGLGGFGLGLDVKRHLLALEGVTLAVG